MKIIILNFSLCNGIKPENALIKKMTGNKDDERKINPSKQATGSREIISGLN